MLWLVGSTMENRDDRMVWIDLEMTGLDLSKEKIIEIATIVTDGELNIIAEGPNLAVSVEETLLEGMDEWNTRHHHRSGLVERVRNNSVTVEEAERQTMEFLRQHVNENKAPLCGNSVSNDRLFLQKEMPEIVEFLHYRMIDVSTVKELGRRWYPEVSRYNKRGAHLALDDIRESVQELAYFRKRIFISHQ